MTPSSSALLLAEDDANLQGMLRELLASEGYEVTAVRDGAAALQAALNGQFDVVVLDRGLPLLGGLEVLSRLRQRGWAVPVLVLSAYGTPADRVAGLDAGAEDYLAKPFDVDELLARLRALLRRHLDAAAWLPVAGGSLDVEGHIVRRDDGRTVPLSPRETALLVALAARPAQVHSRSALLHRVFDDADADGVVDTYVHYLRRKLGKGVVRTVTGVGYQLGPVAGDR
jgi:two-component system response regulator QseB